MGAPVRVNFLDLIKPASAFPAPGIYLDVPEDVYHADKTSISNSALTEFRRSPQHFLHWRENGSDETRYDVFGKALHCYALEQQKKFELKYIVKPVFEGKTKEGKLTTSQNCAEVKAKHEAFEKKHAGKVIISAEDSKQVEEMSDALYANGYFSKVTANGFPEITIVWIDPDTGIKCRGRIDWFNDSLCVAYDLKGIDGCSPREMRNKAFNFSYQFQSTMYSEGLSILTGLSIETYVLGCIEKSKPHEIAHYAFDDLTIQDTRVRYKKSLADLKECMEKNEWPGYPRELITLEAPRWLQYE